ncbi:MAG TPA: hypothetical protein VF783_15535 [Terriglobales bacterium]
MNTISKSPALNIKRYWDGLLAIRIMRWTKNFVRPENSLLVRVASTPEGMLKCRSLWTPPEYIEKWLGDAQR